MNKDWQQVISQFFEAKTNAWLSGKTDDLLPFANQPEVIRSVREDIHALCRSAKSRGLQYRKARTNLKVLRAAPDRRGKAHIELLEQITFIYKDGDELQHQGRMQPVQFVLGEKAGGWEIELIERIGERDERNLIQAPLDFRPLSEVNSRQVRYDRRRAQRYAELWWNSFNPNYKKFDVDCTNFVSQCLLAGGMPMTAASRKDRGWWYMGQGNQASWSYSWAVAHALRWYLEGSGRTIAAARPDELAIGDIICYDFDGDGRWQHNTIVVDFDRNGMPLVNAHTVASQRRYWDYQDSYAWTENTKYRFLRIRDVF